MLCGISASCRKDEAKVIPRGKLAKIYAEMLVTDQWVTTTPGIRMIADTSLVYEPILEKYGYDSDDYRSSVEHYMNDPERFGRILRTTIEILDKRILELEEVQRLLDLKAKLPKIEADFHPEEFFPYLFDEPYVHYYDSVAFVPDSLLWIYRLVPIERADTIYDQIRMIIRDTLAISDSLAIKDSLAAAEDKALHFDLMPVSDKSLKQFVEDPSVRGRENNRVQRMKMDKLEFKN